MSQSSLSSSSSIWRLFVDPASISSGWALFCDDELKEHGTIAVDRKKVPFERLREIYLAYCNLSSRLWVHEVHIEQLPRTCHIYTHYSVCAIGMPFVLRCNTVVGDIPVSSWQKFCDWKNAREMLAGYKVDSEDELAAIGMGLWYLKGRHK